MLTELWELLGNKWDLCPNVISKIDMVYILLCWPRNRNYNRTKHLLNLIYITIYSVASISKSKKFLQ